MMDVHTDGPRSPIRRLTGVQVVGVGSYVPDQIVRNEDLQAELGCDPEWIVQRTGIRERRHLPPGLATSDMAFEAARRCLKDAGVTPADVDLLIVGTFTPDMPCPSTACLVQDRLGLRAPAMDIHAACAGFLYSLVTGMQFVATGCSKLALIIGADCNSRIVDRGDKKTFPLFGDGAGAVLLSVGSPRQGLLAYTLGSDGAGGPLLKQPMGGSLMPPFPAGIEQKLHCLQMDGRAVFKWAIRVLDDSVRSVVKAAEMDIAELNLVLLHQANIRIIDGALESLGISKDKTLINVDRYGNTSAASVPLALDEAMQAGRVKRGDRILMCGFGAGLAWGSAVLAW